MDTRQVEHRKARRILVLASICCLTFAVPPALATQAGSAAKKASVSSTWVQTETYQTPGAGTVACLPGLSSVPGANVGGGCFNLDHPYTDIASITVADGAVPSVNGSWQIQDAAQNILASGAICANRAVSLPSRIPAGSSTLFVVVGDPTVTCTGSGAPAATQGTIKVTYGIPAGSMTRFAGLPPACVSGAPGGAHAMPYLKSSQSTVQPPAVTLPCGLPWPPPPAGQPSPVNMAYFGGHVQVQPKIYLVLWGWHAPNAFRDAPTGNNPSYDPDGAAARMIAFLSGLGGSKWAGVQTQYYETDAQGKQINIQNPTNQLAGVWWDDSNPIHDNLDVIDLATEAQRAMGHFGVTDLLDSNFVIAQPQDYNDGGFSGGAGYCAFHDYTEPFPYPYVGITPGISYTNMPYIINQGSSCGANAVNSGAAGQVDGESIVLGHEAEETVTDPGAEDTVGGQHIGGWYDYSMYENGDKCAWVGEVPGVATLPIPGSVGTMTGHDGKTYPVQSLWSNQSAGGLGYCAGTNNDLPF
jgi:serine protease